MQPDDSRSKTINSNSFFLCFNDINFPFLSFLLLLSPIFPPAPPSSSLFWCVCFHGFWTLSNSIWPQQRRRHGEKKHFHMCKLGTPPTPPPYTQSHTNTSCTYPHWLPRLLMVIKGRVFVGPQSESVSCHDCNVYINNYDLGRMDIIINMMATWCLVNIIISISFNNAFPIACADYNSGLKELHMQLYYLCSGSMSGELQLPLAWHVSKK